MAGHSIGERKVLLDDWDELDELLENFPSPWEPEVLMKSSGSQMRPGLMFINWGAGGILHERFWNIRGMENLCLILIYERTESFAGILQGDR